MNKILKINVGYNLFLKTKSKNTVEAVNLHWNPEQYDQNSQSIMKVLTIQWNPNDKLKFSQPRENSGDGFKIIA